MRIKSILILLFISAVFCGKMVASPTQRVAILPDGIITIKPGMPVKVPSLYLDYFRIMPYGDPIINYDQIYSDEGVTITINGKPGNISFRTLVQETDPLLNLSPMEWQRGFDVQFSLITTNPASKNIDSIQIQFTSPIMVGNEVNDMDVSEAQLIFRTWGYEMSQEVFWHLAQCLEILKINNKITISKGTSTALVKDLCAKMLSKYDLRILNENAFKTLIDTKQICLDDNLDLTVASMQNIKMAYNYSKALNDAIMMNCISYFSNTSLNEQALSNEAKVAYYRATGELTDLSTKSHRVEDTIIAGKRYVAMVAWKSASFMGYTKKLSNSAITYTSDPTFFNYALFLTTPYDLARTNILSFDSSQWRARMMEILGLPPISTNDLFVEFWVKESDIFRPTADSSLSGTGMLQKVDETYLSSLQKYARSSYSDPNIYKQYPFTALGYTWDCSANNVNHFGATEFVLKENRTIYLRRTASTADYIRRLGKR